MFKKIILSAISASVALTPIVAASAEAQTTRTVTTVKERRNGTVVQRTVTTRANGPRNWRAGQRFDRRYAPGYAQIDYRQFRGRGLYAPPRGYRWVRSGRDAVLVADRGGTVRTVVTRIYR
jgi:Ni/Co efflux regulator RcnB